MYESEEELSALKGVDMRKEKTKVGAKRWSSWRRHIENVKKLERA